MASKRTTSVPSATTAALLVTWVVWGSTFLAIHAAVRVLPPLVMMGSRFVAAGTIALALASWFGRRRGTSLRVDRTQLREATVVGAGLVTVGMGATAWAVTRLETGIAALLVASAPLWIAVLGAVQQRRAPPSLVAAGVAVGTLGVAILVAPIGGSAATHVDVIGAVVVVLANAVWAAASLRATRIRSSGDVLLDMGMQMLIGGTLLVGAGAAVGEFGQLSLGAVDATVAGSWAYLVLAGALGGFLAYGWLLEQTSPSLASTHAFVNPLVAVGLGAAVLGEAVGLRTLAAGGAVLVAVVALLLAERRGAGAPDAAPARRRSAAAPSRRAAGVGRRGRPASGWLPAPTPSFARRTARPWSATDGMDALAIDAAFDRAQES